MEGQLCQGVGIIPGTAYRTEKLSRFGYIQVQSKSGTTLGQEVGISPAHEFHYFDSHNSGKDCYAQKPNSKRGWECIHSTDTMLAGFPHFYYYGNPKLAEAYLQCCQNYHTVFLIFTIMEIPSWQKHTFSVAKTTTERTKGGHQYEITGSHRKNRSFR